MQRLNINSKDIIAKTIAVVLSIGINFGICWGLVRFSNVFSENRQEQIAVYMANIPLSSTLGSHHSHINNKNQESIKKRILGGNAATKHKLLRLLAKVAMQDKKLADSHIKSNFFHVIEPVNKIKLIQKGINNGKISHIKIKFKEQDSLKNWIKKHKFYPREAIFEQEEGVVKIAFSVDKSRNIKNIHIIKKSSYGALNEAALKILTDSAPIPVAILSGLSLPIHTHINIIFMLNQ